MKGWYRDSYRHSLAARGISTRLSLALVWGSREHVKWVEKNAPEELPGLLEKIKARRKNISEGVKKHIAERKKERDEEIKKYGLDVVLKEEEAARREKILKFLEKEFPGVTFAVPVVVDVAKKVEEEEEKKDYEEDLIEGVNFSPKRKSFTMTEAQLDKLESIEEQIGAELSKPETDFAKVRNLREEMREVIKG